MNQKINVDIDVSSLVTAIQDGIRKAATVDDWRVSIPTKVAEAVSTAVKNSSGGLESVVQSALEATYKDPAFAAEVAQTIRAATIEAIAEKTKARVRSLPAAQFNDLLMHVGVISL